MSQRYVEKLDVVVRYEQLRVLVELDAFVVVHLEGPAVVSHELLDLDDPLSLRSLYERVDWSVDDVCVELLSRYELQLYWLSQWILIRIDEIERADLEDIRNMEVYHVHIR